MITTITSMQYLIVGLEIDGFQGHPSWRQSNPMPNISSHFKYSIRHAPIIH
jgi:hypothetical protein